MNRLNDYSRSKLQTLLCLIDEGDRTKIHRITAKFWHDEVKAAISDNKFEEENKLPSDNN